MRRIPPRHLVARGRATNSGPGAAPTTGAALRTECIPLASPRSVTRSLSLTFRAYAVAAGWPLVPPTTRVGGTSAETDIHLAGDHDTLWISAVVTRRGFRGAGRSEH
jgi:hypothetical protein